MHRFMGYMDLCCQSSVASSVAHPLVCCGCVVHLMQVSAASTCWLQVAEQGTHSELVNKGGIYWNLVRRQQKGLGPADRDLSPRSMRDPPMLSSRDWDYGEAGRPMQSR